MNTPELKVPSNTPTTPYLKGLKMNTPELKVKYNTPYLKALKNDEKENMEFFKLPPPMLDIKSIFYN